MDFASIGRELQASSEDRYRRGAVATDVILMSAVPPGRPSVGHVPREISTTIGVS